VWSRLLWMGVALTVPAVLIAMVIPMLSESAMHALEKEVVPGLTIQVLILFILVTPVQFGLGSRFYIGAYKALKYVVSPFCARVSSGDLCKTRTRHIVD
jgi:Cu+-exporting ATPase